MKNIFTKLKDHILAHKLYYIYTTLMAILLISVAKLSEQSAAFSEWYSTHIYKLLQGIISRITGLFPFSVFELLIAIIAIVGIYTIIQTIHRIITRNWCQLRSLYARLLSAALTALLVFELNCGVNYHRLPFSSFSGLTIEKSSEEQLISLAKYLISEANKVVPYIDTKTTEQYGVLFTLDNTDEQKEAVLAMEKLGELYPQLSGYYPRPKPILCSFVMSYEFITGVYSAFTIEANYNNDVPDHEKAYTICHELSHLRGFMREDEAEFIAHLACVGSDNINFVYCGYANALVHVLNTIYTNCGADVHRELYLTLDEQYRRDFAYNSAYWDKYETPVAEVADAVNNVYLQANAQVDGVKSYGRMVDLLLAYYRNVCEDY